MEFLSWVESDQNRYLAIAQTALFAFCGLIVAAAFLGKLNARLSTPRGTLVYLSLVLLVFMAARWPTFFVVHPLNEDEAQMIAQAITVPHDPVPWVGFDGLTSGPLNTYALDLPVLLGQGPSFMSTRILTVLVEFGALAALYASAALCFGAGIARLAVVPPLVFWAVSVQDELVHYSSELLSIALCATAVALLCWAWRRSFPARILYAAGFVSGMVPFAKLQAVPLAASIALVTVVAVLAAGTLDVRHKLLRLAALAGGALTFPLLLLAIVAAGGGLRDFWLSYILSSLAYVVPNGQPLGFLTASPEFGPYFDWLFAVAILGGLIVGLRFRSIDPGVRNAYLAAVVILAGAIAAVYSPRRGSLHYLQYGVVPIAAAAAAGLAAIAWYAAREPSAAWRRGALAAAFVAVCLTVQNAVLRPHYNWIGADFYAYRQGGPPDPLAAAIERHLQPGERLAIWGWVPEYWIYSSTLLGTRDAVSVNQYTPYFNPYRDYYRARYVADFERIRPQGFLEAGAESWDWGGGFQDAYTSFPELAAIVNRDYVLAASWKRFKFFMRRDLVLRKRGA